LREILKQYLELSSEDIEEFLKILEEDWKIQFGPDEDKSKLIEELLEKGPERV